MRYYRIVVTDPPVPPAGRNAPCPCGSGIKFKRCHGGRKPRTRTITLDYGRSLDPGAFDEMFLSAGTVQLRRFGVPIIPISATTQESYERDKSAKVLYRFPPRAIRAGTNPNGSLRRTSTFSRLTPTRGQRPKARCPLLRLFTVG